MNPQLPEAVKAYFEISNGGDASCLTSCFSADATVTDENRTHQGIEAIDAWQHEVRQAFTYQVEPLEAVHKDGRLAVTAQVTGNFPGSPITLNHLFLLEKGRIRSLEIAP